MALRIRRFTLKLKKFFNTLVGKGALNKLLASCELKNIKPSLEVVKEVEFVRGGKVIGREVASVVSQADIAQVADGPRPASGGARVELLKGNDYVRVWINRGGMNYIIHLPPAKS